MMDVEIDDLSWEKFFFILPYVPFKKNIIFFLFKRNRLKIIYSANDNLFVN